MQHTRPPDVSDRKRSCFPARGSFWLGVWFFVLSVVLYFILRLWPGDQLPAVRLTNYLMPWLLCGLVPAFIVACLGRRKWLAMVLSLPSLFIGFTYAPLFRVHPDTALAVQQPIKIMSYNVWRKNKNMSAVAKIIRQEKPDILLVQELGLNQIPTFIEALNGLYPDAEFHLAYERRLLQAVVSRYPIISSRALPDMGQAQKVLIQLPQSQLSVFNVHPQHWAWPLRLHQVTALMEEEIAKTDGPLILGGDFNTTEQGQTYRFINEFLHNAHWEGGFGFGFSFPANVYCFNRKISTPPLVRIDHIFYNNHFSINKAGTLQESGDSDHLPVVAELFLSAPKEFHRHVLP